MKNALFRILLCCALLLGAGSGAAQDLAEQPRIRRFPADSIREVLLLDTLSIIPGSFRLSLDGQAVEDSLWVLDAPAARLLFTAPIRLAPGSVLQAEYRCFPLSFVRPRYVRDRRLLEQPVPGRGAPATVYTERPADRNRSLFGLEGLTRSGSISRGLTIGNNQDAVLNSSLNLQLAGRIGGNVELLAAITDENIPVQPEGNTQQLQEFDRVFIQLSDPHNKLIAGDYDVRNPPDGYFLRYFKKAQGGLYQYNETFRQPGRSPLTVSAGAGAAVSRGKFNRMVFPGIESNQGPYRLRGADNELFIVVMSNSERVFIDGVLLERGQDRDYIIDYNTAEITFTTRRLITKDLRIIVEFQYADRNYARTLLTANTAFSSTRWKASLAFYNEQDSRNQPLQQTLDASDKALLASVGDSVDLAFADGGDSVAFNSTETLYARSDTTVGAVTYTIYRYSTSPDSAYYRVSFTNLGAGQGNYLPDDATANGRIYRWVAPVGGIAQGTHEPRIRLIAPQQRQMLSGRMQVSLTEATNLTLDLAMSRNDLNRFSDLDQADDDGYAARVVLDHRQPLRRSRPGDWMLQAELNTEVNDRNFRPIEVYRSVEFSRDWNTTGLDPFDKELLGRLQLALVHPKRGEMRYGLRNFLRGGSYTGWMQTVNGRLPGEHWFLQWDASLLDAQTPGERSQFLRHREELRRRFGTWIPGVRVEQERNSRKALDGDTLQASAFSFRIYDAFVQRPDSVRWNVKATLTRREDDGRKGGDFALATVADMASAGLTWTTGPRQRIGFTGNYRNLRVIDSLISPVGPEESAAGRLDYGWQSKRGVFSVNGFYEGGTGREPRRLYSYVQVAAGTGNYTWNDYNGDGVPQPNEFEVALFTDQANYIRISASSDEYIKVFFNQLNGVLNFNPALMAGLGNRKPWWSRFSVLSTLRYDNRFTASGTWSDWNPLYGGRPDSALITGQSNARHTLFFDRNGAVLAADLSWQQQDVRQLLASGSELRNTDALSSTIRWNLVRWFNWQQRLERSERVSAAENFSNRDYNLLIGESDTRFNLQPGSTYRITLLYKVKQKQNRQAEGLGEEALLQDIGFEGRYNSVRKGLYSARFNLVKIAYDGAENTPLAYEMLEGLNAGTNLTWGLNVQRNLGASLQLSINYDGRRPAGGRIIHTGGAQVRAYF